MQRAGDVDCIMGCKKYDVYMPSVCMMTQCSASALKSGRRYSKENEQRVSQKWSVRRR